MYACEETIKRIIGTKKIFTWKSSGILLIIIIAIAWELFMKTGYMPIRLLPPPSVLLNTLIELLSSGELLEHTSVSIQRVLIGYLLALSIGIPLGIMMGWSEKMEYSVYPVVEILRPIPPIAWTPLAIVWFGIGSAPAIFIIFIGAYFPILLNTIDGVKGIEKRLVEFARTLGATDRDILWRVVPMSALPSIITGMRVGLGIGWMCVVAAEMIASNSGLGYMIMDARYFLATDKVIIGMLTIGMIGLSMDICFRKFESIVLKWRKGLTERG